MNKKQLTGFLLAAAAFAFILLYPDFSDISKEGQRCLALFVLVFFLYSFEVLHAAIISLAIVPLLVILGVVPLKTALSGFASSSTYLIVGAFFLTGAMVKTGLGDRITYHILKLVGTKTRNVSFGIMCVCIIMAFLIPSSTARTAMLLPICLKIIEQYGGSRKERTKFGANIMMTLCCTNSTISSGILTSTITNPMAVEYIEKITGQHISYRMWLQWGFVPALICTILAWWLIQVFFRPERAELSGGTEYIDSKLKEMGKIRADEIRVGVILIAAVLLWLLGDTIGLDSTTVCLTCACILCLPKLGCLTWEDCKNNVSLNVMFVVSGGISLGAAMNDTGTATWLAENIFRIFGLERLSVHVIIISVIVIIQFSHLFFAGTATMANVFFPVIAGIASVAEISPVVLIIVTAFMIGGYPILMFFNTTPNILCYDTGQLTAGDFVRFGSVLSVVVCIIYAFCTTYYWPVTGLM